MRFTVPDNASDILAAARRNRLKWIAGEVEVRLPGPNRLGQTRRSGARRFLPAGPLHWAEPKVQFRPVVPSLAYTRSWGSLSFTHWPWSFPRVSLIVQRDPLQTGTVVCTAISILQTIG